MSKEVQKTGKLDPQLKEAVTAAYKLGILEGEHRIERLHRCMMETNRALLELCREIDLHYPLDGTLVPFILSQRVIWALKRQKHNAKLLAEFQRLVEGHENDLRNKLADVKEQLVEVVEDGES